MSPEVLHEAAEWLVRLGDQPSGREPEAFRVWLTQDSEHLEAFQRMQETLAPLQVLKQAPAGCALLAFKQQRSAQKRKALALFVILALPLGMFVQQKGATYQLADIRTGSSEGGARQLPGSLPRLDSDSAVDPDFDASGHAEVQATKARGVEQAWARNQWVVRERPLVEVLEQLGCNHSGYLLFDRKALANIRVTAVLPADDSERALRLLAQGLPLGIDHYTPWITRVRYLPESTLR